MKMRRLAEIFHVDVAAIHEMWIVQSGAEDAKAKLNDALPALRECFAGFTGSLIMDVYGGRLLIFMRTPISQQEAERLSASVIDTVTPQLNDSTLCRCSGLQSTADVRAAYLSCKEDAADHQAGHADHAAGPDSRDGKPALTLTRLYFESALFFAHGFSHPDPIKLQARSPRSRRFPK